jgi:PPOX class probable F420-dependent enzyme
VLASTMRRRAADARVARLGTVTGDDAPHLVPVCFVIHQDVLYSAIDDLKPKTTMRLRRVENIERNPAVSVLIDEYAEDWSALWWIRLDGRARVVDSSSPTHATACRLLAEKYEQYRRRPPPGPVVEVAIETWSSWP